MLKRDADRRLTGVIEIDDVCWGAESHGETPGCGSANKISFIAAMAENRHTPSIAQ
jgi:hypothetical protein